MKIGEAARSAGLTARQVRFYDETGVIRRPSRVANGYRYFSLGEIERLLLVRRLRELDLPLHEICASQLNRVCGRTTWSPVSHCTRTVGCWW